MPVLTQPRYTGEFLLSEGEGIISRDAIKFASGAGVVKPGMVIGKITASGKWKPHDPAATDGSQNAAGINFSPVDATAADTAGVGIVRYAEVKGPMIIYHATTDTQAEFDAVNAQLAALGIIVR